MADDTKQKADIIPYTAEFSGIVRGWIDSARTARNLGILDGYPPDDSIPERWQKSGVHGFILITGGVPVAYADVVERPPLLAVEFMHVLVEPSVRNQGYGSLMLNLLYDRVAHRREIAKVIINLEGDNKAALGCYFRAGFELAAANQYVAGLTLVRLPGKQVRTR
jgi:GNAT superfamily N-acetyltransferase